MDESLLHVLRDTDIALLSTKGRHRASFGLKVRDAQDVHDVSAEPDPLEEDEHDYEDMQRRSPAARLGGRQGPKTLDLPGELVLRMASIIEGTLSTLRNPRLT